MTPNHTRLWHEEDGQDIAEYAVMLAAILAIVVATVQLMGKQANNVFSSVASTIQYGRSTGLWDILGQDRVESRSSVQEIVVRAEVRRGIMDLDFENISFCPRNLFNCLRARFAVPTPGCTRTCTASGGNPWPAPDWGGT